SFAASAPLAAGASYNVQQSITLPATALGSRYLIVQTGQESFATFTTPSETNTANDTFAVPITLQAPDLTVTSLTGVPASAVLGSSITVNWQVKNQASVPAAASYWYDGIYLSDTPTFNSSSAVLVQSAYEGSHSGLAASSTYNESQTVTLPSTPTGNR